MDYQQPPQGQDPNQQPQPGYDPNAYQQPQQPAYDPNMYQQPMYQAPPPNYGGYPPPPPPGGDYPGKGKATASLIFGIVSTSFGLLLNWWLGVIPIFGIFTTALGVAAGVIGLIMSVQARKLMPPGASGMATAGLVLSIIGLVWNAIELFTCGICTTCATCGAYSSLGALGSLL